MAAAIEVRRAGDRFRTRAEGTDIWHSFSFGAHYDPDNVGLGPLLVHDDHRVGPGAGYPEHRHADAEIVTWVLEGALAHEDSTGHQGLVVPGLAQRLSAGAGVVHAERNGATVPVRFLQVWLRPDAPGTPPAYAARPVEPADLGSGWVRVASGDRPDAAVSLGTGGATLWVTRLAPGESRRLPTGPLAHVFVAVGSVEVATVGVLEEGDALRLGEPAPLALTGVRPAEVCVWTVAP